jgi:hypothetical protein
MIDEWFDRSYQEARVELQAGIHGLIALVRATAATARRKGPHHPQPKENPACDTSPLHR